MDLEPGLLRRLLDATRAAIIATDAEGRVTFWSRAAEELYGYLAGEVVGRQLREVLVTADYETPAADIMSRVSRGETWTGAFPVRHKDGTIVTVQVTDAPIVDERGHVLGIVGVSIDLSDRLRAEEALRREQELLRSTIDSAPIILFATDTDGVFTVSRGRALRSLGLREDEVLGRSALEIYGPLSASVRGETMSFADAFQRVVGGESIQAHVVAASVHFDLWLTPTRDASGRIAGVVGVALDVTSRTELEQRLQQAEKLEAVGLLAGGVAHDFNNMLTAILGHAEILAVDLKNERLRDDVEAIQHAAESAAAVTRQLLAFTRRQHQELRPIDVNEAIRSLEQLLRRTLGERITLDLRLTPTPAVITADASQIDQVILNLAINARDAMPNGGRLTVATAVVHGNGHEQVGILVADTGYGMSRAVRDRIFEPFFTTKERGHGTGLGLATVHGIVAQTGGRIFVESQEGSGTAFRILLPKAAHNPVVERSTLDTPAAAPDDAPRERTILVVEDEHSVRQLIATMLTRAGYRVVARPAAADALAALCDNPGAFHLVLTDVVMPGMTGPELAREIAHVRPDLPVVFMSGYADMLGPVEQPDLQKPFTRAQLLACLEKRLGS